jgi:hypothetical protein
VLAELRRARVYTQEQLAASLMFPNHRFRALNTRPTSTFRPSRYVAAMGGQIEIIATFEDNNVRMPLALADLDQTPEIAYGGPRASPTRKLWPGRRATVGCTGVGVIAPTPRLLISKPQSYRCPRRPSTPYSVPRPPKATSHAHDTLWVLQCD